LFHFADLFVFLIIITCAGLKAARRALPTRCKFMYYSVSRPFSPEIAAKKVQRIGTRQFPAKKAI
jgi:hypothetical protein